MRRLALLALVACSSPPPSRPTPVVVVADAGTGEVLPIASPPVQQTARWVPSAAFEDIGERRRGAIVADRRVVLEGVDDTLRATIVDSKPILGLGSGHRVPDVLGGGWVFVGEGGVWSARTYDGALVPIELGRVNQAIGFGIDRILVNGQTYVLSTGARVAPPVPNTAQLFGLADGQVAALTSTHEAFYSPAKGKPFTRIAKGIDALGGDDRGILLGDGNGWQSVLPNGKVGPTMPPLPDVTTSDNLQMFGPSKLVRELTIAPDLERMMDGSARTVAMNDGKVLRVRGSDLEVFDGERGLVVSRQSDAFAHHEGCAMLRGGTPAFVECDDPAATVFLRIDAVDRPPIVEKVLRWSTPWLGAPVPNAALVVPGQCDVGPTPGFLCVRRGENHWVDVAIDDPNGILATRQLAISVVGSSTGTPYGFDVHHSYGLILLDGASRTVRTLAKEAFPEWVWGSSWEARTASDGKLRFLLSGGRSGGVLTIDDQGHVDAIRLDGTFAAKGAKGMLFTPDGHLTETIDAGRTWHDVPLPPGGVVDAKPMRCGEAGCTLGAWHRLGWRR